MAEDTIALSAPETQALKALMDLVTSAANPDALEAQTILLRRLALQGNVTGSRVPAPRNISEIGGYLNLLETMGQSEITAQTLTGILGVAGPNPPLGWKETRPPLALVCIANDRPDVPAQAAIPLHFWARSDFAPALQGALSRLHDQGCTLPLLATPAPLPPAGPGATAPADVLAFLGRALSLVPASALKDPATDPIVLARVPGELDFRPMARVLAPGTVVVAPANWEALVCNDNSCTVTAQANAQYVPLGPALGSAGFYAESPLPQPASLKSVTWAQTKNVTGLVAGVTRLGDELALLYSPADINASVLAARLQWVWDGKSFVPGT